MFQARLVRTTPSPVVGESGMRRSSVTVFVESICDEVAPVTVAKVVMACGVLAALVDMCVHSAGAMFFCAYTVMTLGRLLKQSE
jgi:hypothetical protein